MLPANTLRGAPADPAFFFYVAVSDTGFELRFCRMMVKDGASSSDGSCGIPQSRLLFYWSELRDQVLSGFAEEMVGSIRETGCGFWALCNALQIVVQ